MELALVSLRLVGLLVPFDIALQFVRYPTPLDQNYSDCGRAGRGVASPYMYSKVRVRHLKHYGVKDLLLKILVFQLGEPKKVVE
jgi:hypothetical protein